jgi:alcohol dehydrogenase
VLIVTDPGVLEAGLVERVGAALDEVGLPFDVYETAEGEPSIPSVEELFAAYRDSGADAMVAVGGGSVLDSCKAAGILADNPGPLERYHLGQDPIRNRIPPLITIPTTAGTGAEISTSAVVMDREDTMKLVLAGPAVSPWVALDDATMTLTLPPALTACSGMDALSHCIERFTNAGAVPHTDAPAIRGVRLIGASLRRAVFDGEDLEARDSMLAGSLLGGMSRTGLTIAHAIGQTLGAFHVAHGLACAIPLPHVMRFNAVTHPERLIEVAEALGEPVSHLSDVAAARRAAEAVEELMQDVGMPTRLSEMGLRESDVDELAEATMRDNGFVVKSNPRRASLEDVRKLCWEMF